MSKIAEALHAAKLPLTDEQALIVSAYEAAMRVHREEAFAQYVTLLARFTMDPNDINETRVQHAYMRLRGLL